MFIRWQSGLAGFARHYVFVRSFQVVHSVFVERQAPGVRIINIGDPGRTIGIGDQGRVINTDEGL